MSTDDIDSLDAAFVPGTGWPEPGGLLPREAHKLVGGVAKEGLCGMELVEVCTPLHGSCWLGCVLVGILLIGYLP